MSSVAAKPAIIDFGYEKETIKVKVATSADISSVTITVPDWIELTGTNSGVLTLTDHKGFFYISPKSGIFEEKTSHAITIDGTLASTQTQVLWSYDASMMSLDDLIDDLMVQMTDDHLLKPLKKHQLMSIASRGLREFSFDGMQKRRLLEVKVDDTGRVPFPFDMIKLIQASVVGEDGFISPIYTDDRLNASWSHKQDQNGYLVTDQNGYAIDVTGLAPKPEKTTQPDGLSGSDYSGYYRYGDGTNGRQYGISGGIESFSGKKSIDFVGNEIVFADTPTDYVVLEYLSDPILLHNSGIKEGKLGVHKFYQAAMESFIVWNGIKNRANVDMNSKVRAEQDYINQKRLGDRRFINLDDIFQSMKAGIKHMKY